MRWAGEDEADGCTMDTQPVQSQDNPDRELLHRLSETGDSNNSFAGVVPNEQSPGAPPGAVCGPLVKAKDHSKTNRRRPTLQLGADGKLEILAPSIR